MIGSPRGTQDPAAGPLPAWACPSCRGPLDAVDPGLQRCAGEGLAFPLHDGIWRFTLPGFEERFGRFLCEYTTVRHAEGRGSTDADYYRSLPDHARGSHAGEWSIRARSFRAMLDGGVVPRPGAPGYAPLHILDLGAGNGWLSARLAELGHSPVAVDLSVDDRDGLGAARFHDAAFTKVQADFDHLPFAPAQFDRAIWNASLHYSVDYRTSLEEALRVLGRDGRLVVLDSPLYRDPESGRAMVREREAGFRARFGFASDALPSEQFLTDHRLTALGRELGLEWEALRPRYGLRWALRPLKARLLRRREPARFLVLVGRRRPT